jgi:hypothetical protein
MDENFPPVPGSDPAAPADVSAELAAKGAQIDELKAELAGQTTTVPTAQARPSAATETAGEGFSSSKPILMVGAAGDDVAELGYLLAEHGFPNAVSEGTAEAPPILDDALMRAVVEFQQANGINLFEPIGGEGLPVLRQGVHTGAVEAHTWTALLGYQPKVVPAGAKA